MQMYCYQCQETAKNKACTITGACGKTPETSNLQDLLIYTLKGISVLAEKEEKPNKKYAQFIIKSLFATITNANFDNAKIKQLIDEGLKLRDELKEKIEEDFQETRQDVINWTYENDVALENKAKEVNILSCEDEDVRSLRELLIYGTKGIAAYADHALVLGFENDEIYDFIIKALASTTKELSIGEMTALVLKAGKTAVTTMALLDTAHTTKFGSPVVTTVDIGVKSNPGILVSGHDLKDIKELIDQTKGTGIDIYTHSEMLPAHYYPRLKQNAHFVGNYGNSWWKQSSEFESFNGPILMTTNCITPVKESYKERMFTTGMAGYPGVKHIPTPPDGGKKDFSQIIALAKTCPPPSEIETGEIVGGFAHQQVFALAERIVEAIKSGAIKRFIVMAGCDGRSKSRSYFTEVAERLPRDTIILTAGCAKYRYNKLPLGSIAGIPRVLDAGQCNDSYSLVVIALKLKEIFDLQDINDLPLSFDLAWYEQKAVTVLLALLSLGVKGIRLGPTLPGFVSANVLKILVEKFDIKLIESVEGDIESMMQGNAQAPAGEKTCKN